MTPDNTQKLFNAYPHLYRGREKSLQESLMSWGFTCSDGWFDLVWTLSQNIEDIAKAARLEPQCDEWPEAVQVKEKFGTLRFHLKRSPLTTSDKVEALIREAELCSAKICEECGKPGLLKEGGGTRTLCEDHAKELPDYVEHSAKVINNGLSYCIELYSIIINRKTGLILLMNEKVEFSTFLPDYSI